MNIAFVHSSIVSPSLNQFAASLVCKEADGNFLRTVKLGLSQIGCLANIQHRVFRWSIMIWLNAHFEIQKSDVFGFLNSRGMKIGDRALILVTGNCKSLKEFTLQFCER